MAKHDVFDHFQEKFKNCQKSLAKLYYGEVGQVKHETGYQARWGGRGPHRVPPIAQNRQFWRVL